MRSEVRICAVFWAMIMPDFHGVFGMVSIRGVTGDDVHSPISSGLRPASSKGQGSSNKPRSIERRLRVRPFTSSGQREDSTSPDVEGFEADRKGAAVKRSEAVEPAARLRTRHHHSIHGRRRPHAARAGAAYETLPFRLAAEAAIRRCAPCRNACGPLLERSSQSSMSAITPIVLESFCGHSR